MQIQFQNHASLLIRNEEGYLLTDPWYNQPAFGSWLPTFPPYVHPVYLAALGHRLSVLISHGHDDHLDDRLMGLLDPDTLFVTANFKSPSVLNRLKNLGFENVISVGEEERQVRGLSISSFIVPEISHDDAVYLIRDNSGAVIHTNDVWHPFEERHMRLIQSRVGGYEKESILIFSQTNSAAGYPMNYRNFTPAEKRELLEQKVVGMVKGGLENALSLGCDRSFSYAGFATLYVRTKDYDQTGFMPTARNLSELLTRHKVELGVEIEDFLPGDVIDLPSGVISKAFISDYKEESIRLFSTKFYEIYGNIEECLSYRVSLDWSCNADWGKWLDLFLLEFEKFSLTRVKKLDAHFSDLVGKTFSIEVAQSCETSLVRTLEFGRGLVERRSKPNKICFVEAGVMEKVLTGEALFEDLSTGYLAEWARNPVKPTTVT